MSRKVTDPRVRFMRFVDKTDGCWTWEGCKIAEGYGQLNVANKMVYAHRFSYELHNGSIPPGYHVHHSCRVRNCVAPNHLQAVTPLEHKALEKELVNGTAA